VSTPIEVAAAATQALEAAGVPCAVGGALALGIWSQPRATLDADVNVFVDDAGREQALRVLAAAGFDLDVEDSARRWAAGHVAHARRDGVHVDLFAPSIAFYGRAAATVQRVHIAGVAIPVLSAESLAVFKLLFFRTKDLADLESLVRDMGPALDHVSVRREIGALMGEDDERTLAWDRIVREAAG
jgi:hypothetical protein